MVLYRDMIDGFPEDESLADADEFVLGDNKRATLETVRDNVLAAGAAQFVPQSSGQSPLAAGRTVYLGDSIMLASDTNKDFFSISFPTVASINSQQRLQEVRNSAVGGDSTADMLARFDTDVAAYNPSIVVIMGGTNDSAESVDVDDYAANITALVDRTTQLGATPILLTVPPNDGSSPADRYTRIANYNTWLRYFCASRGIHLIDAYEILVDESDGNYDAAYYFDGTHPNNAGYRAIGEALAAYVNEWCPNTRVPLAKTNLRGNNLVSQGMFLGSITSNVPSGWTASPGTTRTGFAAALDTSDTDIKGNWYVATLTNLADTQTLFQTVSSGIVAGHRYAFCGRVKVESPNDLRVMARILFNGSTAAGYQFRAMNTLTVPFPDGVFYIEATAPGDATTCQVNFQYDDDGGTSADGTVSFAQITLVDLTAAEAA